MDRNEDGGFRLDRRTFGLLAGASVLGSWAPASRAASAARLKVGTQHGSSDEIQAVLAALGVNHICSALPSPRLDEHWSVDGLTKLRERVESFGIHLDMAPLPLSSHYITQAEGAQAFAYTFGYIKALVRVVDGERVQSAASWR